jgi:hypothetical protein
VGGCLGAVTIGACESGLLSSCGLQVSAATTMSGTKGGDGSRAQMSSEDDCHPMTERLLWCGAMCSPNSHVDLNCGCGRAQRGLWELTEHENPIP